MKSCKDYSIIAAPVITNTVEVVGVSPIEVQKNQLGEVTRFTIRNTQEIPDAGEPGKDGENATINIGTVETGNTSSVTNTGTPTHAILNFVLQKGKDGEAGESIKGDPGQAPTITIGTVTLDDYTSVTNVGTDTDLILNFTLQRGARGLQGDPGLANGLSDYKIAVGNNSGAYVPMGTFSQGTFVYLGANDYQLVRKVRIRAWVTVANMQNWTTLKLTSGNQAVYNGANLVSQRVKHSEGQLYVGQYEISKYIETTDEYIGFTFADNIGGNYSSDGAQYGDYGLEVFILP